MAGAHDWAQAGGINTCDSGTANLIEPFPWKPKGMHWRTYWRLRHESEEADMESLMEESRRFGLLRGMGQ